MMIRISITNLTFYEKNYFAKLLIIFLMQSFFKNKDSKEMTMQKCYLILSPTYLIIPLFIESSGMVGFVSKSGYIFKFKQSS